MKLREIINSELSEAMSGQQMDKLASFLQRVKAGKVSQQGMMKAGFNLKSPAMNNESQLVRNLSTALNLRMDEQDLRKAMAEVGVKSASQLVQAWNKSATAAGQERTAPTRREGTKTQQF